MGISGGSGRFFHVCLGLTDDEIDSVRHALTHCLDPSTGAVVEPDDYLKSERVCFATADACRELPEVDKEGFDVATLLEAFWMRYLRVVDAPFYSDAPAETFVFSLPPKPYLSDNLRIGFASATLEKKRIESIFPDIAFYDAALTEWVAEV